MYQGGWHGNADSCDTSKHGIPITKPGYLTHQKSHTHTNGPSQYTPRYSISIYIKGVTDKKDNIGLILWQLYWQGTLVPCVGDIIIINLIKSI